MAAFSSSGTPGGAISANEIGLEEGWFEDGILQLDPDVAPGTDVVALHRLEDDVLDVEVTSNRVDAMSVIGLARELGAALGKPVREIDISYDYPRDGDQTGGALVKLKSTDCRRFVAQRFSNVRVRTSPFWMRVRLALAGQRPINNLVDISNFVMLEVGQPLHFYDYEKLAGRRLIVRNGLANETITTLDGEVRKVEPVDLVIADEEQAQCLAGLRGARSSEVTESTHELLLEAASFSGARIRRMSIAHGLRTDASSRHEKSLPLALGAVTFALILVGAYLLFRPLPAPRARRICCRRRARNRTGRSRSARNSRRRERFASPPPRFRRCSGCS